MSPFNRRGDIITRHGKKKNDKDETGNILAKIRFYQSIQPSTKKGGLPPLDPPTGMYLLGDGHLILRGIWKFFFRNKYSGQVMSKNKINILSRNEIQHK